MWHLGGELLPGPGVHRPRSWLRRHRECVAQDHPHTYVRWVCRGVWLATPAYHLTHAGLVLFERHHSVTRESGAVAVKIFISQFVNTGIVVLFVHGKLPNNMNNPVASLGVFGGKHDDFTAEWYGNVGSLLCLTMVANIFTPHFEHFFGWCLQKRSRKKAGTEGGFLTQGGLPLAMHRLAAGL